jgi:hypothetical protein
VFTFTSQEEGDTVQGLSRSFKCLKSPIEGLYTRYILAVHILFRRFKFWVAGPCISFGVHNMNIGLI